jgi:hypothetical protein
LRADRGFVWTNRVAVGQTLSLTRNIYFDGDYAGQGTLKLQLLDVSTVTVPAGTFPGCLRLRSTLSAFGESDVRDDWLAPGIGMVKQQGVSGGGAAERWELIHLQTPGSGARSVAAAAQATPVAPELRLSLGSSASASRLALSAPSLALRLSGPAGVTVIIESSSDMIHWTPVHTNTLSADGLSVPVDATQPGQFFRARLP